MTDIPDYRGKRFRVLQLEQQPFGEGLLWVAVLLIEPGVTKADFDVVVGLGVLDTAALVDAKSRARALVDYNLSGGAGKP